MIFPLNTSAHDCVPSGSSFWYTLTPWGVVRRYVSGLMASWITARLAGVSDKCPALSAKVWGAFSSAKEMELDSPAAGLSEILCEWRDVSVRGWKGRGGKDHIHDYEQE